MSQQEFIFHLDIDELATIFNRYLQRVPVSLALRSTMRMMALSKFIPAESSVLDVGCGDGCFGLLFPESAKIVLDGVDLNESELALARETKAYRSLKVADVSACSLGSDYDIVVGNCSMEHVPDIHGALANILDSLRPGGKLLLSVPAFGWARTLGFVSALERVSDRLGMSAAGALDGFFQHHHLYSHETWRCILEGNGFQVGFIGGLGGYELNRAFERNLPPAFFEFLFKSVFRRYPGWASKLRRNPSHSVLNEIWEQPTAINEPNRIEFLIEAFKPT